MSATRRQMQQTQQRHRQQRAILNMQKALNEPLFTTKAKSQQTVCRVSQSNNYRETPVYPSSTRVASAAAAAKRDSMQYTGDFVVGLATMHKSNIVPVTKDADAREYATMRRS